jgi:hypothetical protein
MADEFYALPKRPAFHDPQYREKMAEYHRNLKIQDLPNEIAHIGQSAWGQVADPRHLNTLSPGTVPAWIRLMQGLWRHGAESSPMGATPDTMRNKLGDEPR